MSLYGNLPSKKDGSAKVPVPAFKGKAAGLVPPAIRSAPVGILKGRGGGRGGGRGDGAGGRGERQNEPGDLTAVLLARSGASGASTASLLSAGTEVEDEYDPALPNNYMKLVEERKRRRAAAEEEAERQEKLRKVEEIKNKLESQGRSDDASPGPSDGVGGLGLGAAPASMGAGDGAAAPKGMGLAQKMLEKMGWQSGQGLGRSRHGITAPLVAQKTGNRSAVVTTIDGSHGRTGMRMGLPSRVICLRNMVGPGEVDDELRGEVGQELSKYGPVNCVVIHEVEPPGSVEDEEAVRVFVEFGAEQDATKALLDMQGRFFGGRTIRAAYFSIERFTTNALAPEPGEFD